MKGTTVSLVVFASTFLFGAVANAQTKHDPECSNATVQGSYGVMFNGTIFGRGLVGGVGVIRFDGEQSWSLVATNVSEDLGVQHFTNDTGTYEVNADCTGSATLTTREGLVTSDFVILDSGREVLLIITFDVPRRVVTWVLKKQFPRHHVDEAGSGRQ